MLNDLLAARVGDRIRFAEEKQAYKIQARGERYLICNKPFNAKRTFLYCIVDLQEKIRGPENLIFGLGAETQEQCEEMLARLEGRDPDMIEPTEISYRNRAPLNVVAVMAANDLANRPEGSD